MKTKLEEFECKLRMDLNVKHDEYEKVIIEFFEKYIRLMEDKRNKERDKTHA